MHRIHRVLVTGHQGYIGSVLAPLLVRCGYDVAGLDAGYFKECVLLPDGSRISTLAKDLRDVTMADLRGFDAVVHLAALSNDPIGNLNAQWTREINLAGSIRLAELAREAGVRRFLLSSSCIMYGLSDAPAVAEDALLDPRTDYAHSKVAAERAIGQLATDGFSPTFLRNGTVYGASPRMRFDTVLNDLLGAALTLGRIVLHGDGSPWRPVVHVEDVARAFAAVLDAPDEIAHNQAYNVGTDALNVRVADLAQMVAAAVPGCEVTAAGSPTADQRSYRADFTKFTRAFPAVTFRSVAQGIQDLHRAFVAVPLTADLYRDPRFVRLRWLRHLLESGRLDAVLRWATPVGAGL